MPSYFYHLAFELYPESSRPGSLHANVQPSNLVAGIIAALAPFHKTQRKSSGGKHRSQLCRTSLNKVVPESSLSLSPSSSSSPSRGPDSGPDGSTRGKRSSPNDIRFDDIYIESMDMVSSKTTVPANVDEPSASQISRGIGVGPATKGRYVPVDSKDVDGCWGIIHLYRDADETPGLYDDHHKSACANATGPQAQETSSHEVAYKEDDCTTLCILAVPSYLTPSDFLGFVGENTRNDVSHFRMIRTARTNRYMVLMKFRSPKKAKEWRKVWNGKVFNSAEPETCHVVFVKSIELQMPDSPNPPNSFPDMTNDPFTPALPQPVAPASASSLVPALSTKPLAPPTPSLVELPTCPVCLERMDETTGLLTILCQHVFHCTCLLKWRNAGCPVCRYSQDPRSSHRLYKYKDTPVSNECSVCHADQGLWVCLICGNVGCGRYDLAHALKHYDETAHCFAMDMATQRVWDYASDAYVHRILQTQPDTGNVLVSLPSEARHGSPSSFRQASSGADYGDDFVPREKLDNIALEYTHLLTSQLESQRTYFEEALERAADKASQAGQSAAAASLAAESAVKKLEELGERYTHLEHAHATLEKEHERLAKRATKLESTARKVSQEWQTEKTINASLMERIRFLDGEVGERDEQVRQLDARAADLADQLRDMQFFISGADQLRNCGDDVVQGTVALPPASTSTSTSSKRKNKGKKQQQ